METQLIIRMAEDQDKKVLYKLFMQVANTKEAFMHDNRTSFEEWEKFWFGENKVTYTALEGNEIVGSYKIAPNQPWLGNHVANGGYMVDAKHRGKRIGELLGKHSIKEAISKGFTAMQFNAVVSTNNGAIKLWEKLAFKIVGECPKAFIHPVHGPTSTYIMYREF